MRAAVMLRVDPPYRAEVERTVGLVQAVGQPVALMVAGMVATARVLLAAVAAVEDTLEAVVGAMADQRAAVAAAADPATTQLVLVR